MGKKPRKWSSAEKLQILKESEVAGVTATIRKYEIYYGMFYRWKEKYETLGEAGLEAKHESVDPEKRDLLLENQQLRQVIADQALQIRVKDELLKKTALQKRIVKK